MYCHVSETFDSHVFNVPTQEIMATESYPSEILDTVTKKSVFVGLKNLFLKSCMRNTDNVGL